MAQRKYVHTTRNAHLLFRPLFRFSLPLVEEELPTLQLLVHLAQSLRRGEGGVHLLLSNDRWLRAGHKTRGSVASTNEREGFRSIGSSRGRLAARGGAVASLADSGGLANNI